MSKFMFNKNFKYFLIFPCAITIMAIVFVCVFGFNKGVDFRGGIQVSVMAENVKFDNSEEFNTFKTKFDEVLTNNDIKASVYIKEVDADTYNNVLVAKIDYTKEDADTLVETLKSDFISVFYSDRSLSEIDNLNLVEVEKFDGFVTSWQIVAGILASLIMALAVAIYLFLRVGLHSAVFGVAFAIINNIITFAFLIVSRIRINAYTISVIPFITIFTLVLTFLFERRAKKLLKSSEKYEKASNLELACDSIKYNYKRNLLIVYAMLVLSLGFTICNIGNELSFLGLAILVAIGIIIYNFLFIMPSLFAITYVRRIGKSKVTAVKNEVNDKLTEDEVLKETDLDNLVSN